MRERARARACMRACVRAHTEQRGPNHVRTVERPVCRLRIIITTTIITISIIIIIIIIILSGRTGCTACAPPVGVQRSGERARREVWRGGGSPAEQKRTFGETNFRRNERSEKGTCAETKVGGNESSQNEQSLHNESLQKRTFADV